MVGRTYVVKYSLEGGRIVRGPVTECALVLDRHDLVGGIVSIRWPSFAEDFPIVQENRRLVDGGCGILDKRSRRA